MKIGQVYTTTELAEKMKWSRQRALRYLRRLHEKNGGGLLVNVGTDTNPRWTVTLEALQSVAREWFTDAEAVDARLTELEEARAATDQIVTAATNQIASLRGKVRTLEATVEVMRSTLEAVAAP